ncbi:alpha/beta hydrolase [Kitasatospora sp. NPDC056138]|uniref:alpha/beta hydrolase n=1 Tax=Kitasatospora sp. NPDC056138 TaxID=3345724 RepID=UPI0035D88244
MPATVPTDRPPGDPARRLPGPLRVPHAVLSAVGLAARHAFELYHPPTAKPGRTPLNKGLPLREFVLTTTRDRIPLHGWVVPGRGPHTVVLCHGMGRTKSSTLGHIELLHRAGWHVVAYDLRNHGESGRDRRWLRMADRFTGDLADVLRWVRADPELGGGEIAVYAFSFSTWVALSVLKRLDDRVAAVVCDSGPMADIRAGLAHYAGLRRSTLPEPLRAGPGFAVYRAGFSAICGRMLAAPDWPPDLGRVPTRLMFVAGGQDTVVPESRIAPVADRYPDAERWTAPNAMHMNAIRFDREEYRERLLTFLTRSFATPGPERRRTAVHG